MWLGHIFHVIMSFLKYIVSIFLLFFLGCTENKNKIGEERKQILVTDFTGNKIELSQPAERVVVLFDPSLDAVYMLGASEKLVGVPVEVYSDEELYQYYAAIDERILEKKMATPGTKKSSNIESIVALNPDLVVLAGSSESFVKNLSKLNIPVYNVKSETYDDILKELQDLGKLLGKEERSKSLVDFTKAKFESIKNRRSKNNKALKTAYFAWANGRIFSTTGTNSMMHTCLELAGVKNVCTTPIDQPNINPETFVSWNPYMVIMWNDSPNLFYDKKQLEGVTAIKERQIYTLMPMFYYNPHTLKALLTTLKINFWAYGELTQEDLGKEVEDILQTLYGKDKGGKLYKKLNNH